MFTDRTQLKGEIADLMLQQVEALRFAVFVGMTDKEWEEYEERLDKVVSLLKELHSVGDPQFGS